MSRWKQIGEVWEEKRHVRILQRLDSVGPNWPDSIKTNETLPDVSFLHSVQCSVENLAVICFSFISFCLKHHLSVLGSGWIVWAHISMFFRGLKWIYSTTKLNTLKKLLFNYLILIFSSRSSLYCSLRNKCWPGTSHNNLSPSQPLSLCNHYSIHLVIIPLFFRLTDSKQSSAYALCSVELSRRMSSSPLSEGPSLSLSLSSEGQCNTPCPTHIWKNK